MVPARFPRYPLFDPPVARKMKKPIWTGWSDPEIHELLLVSRALHAATMEVVSAREGNECWAARVCTWKYFNTRW
jgi:hypothetical protein